MFPHLKESAKSHQFARVPYSVFGITFTDGLLQSNMALLRL